MCKEKVKGIFGQSSVPGILAAAIIVFVSILGCSVKEDRDSCPCSLRLDLTDVFDNADGRLLLTVCGKDGFWLCDTLDAMHPGRDAGGRVFHTVHVPREELRVDVYSPCEAVTDVRRGYRPEGTCARIWKYSETLVAEGEVVERTVALRKEYCSLSVTLAGNGGVAPPFSLVFVSNVDGYLPGGGLSHGLYEERVDPPGSRCTVNLLRQGDASLMMETVPYGSGGVAGSGVGPMRSFALGEYLSASGYDWDAPDLEDVEMSLDFASTSIRISTEKWTRTVEFDVVI